MPRAKLKIAAAKGIGKLWKIKKFHFGLGLNKKRDRLETLIDQRRLDGTKTRIGDKILASASNFLALIRQEEKPRGRIWKGKRYTEKEIIELRKRRIRRKIGANFRNYRILVLKE